MKGEDLGDLPENSSNMMQNDKRPGLSIGRKRPGRVLIKELNDNDVLQGRGSGSMQNTGNIKFRNLVEKLLPRLYHKWIGIINDTCLEINGID